MARLLFLADTHLGFDQPANPRIRRRRRGDDFFKAFERVLAAARTFRVDAIVHGGDLFFRSKIPARLIDQAFEPMLPIAADGIPIYLVPGNHERSVIPRTLFTLHDNIHIFDCPCTYSQTVGKLKIGFSGFPFMRNNARDQFAKALDKTNWRAIDADVRLLCLHQTFQGAMVGLHNYVFRHGPDVIPQKSIPLEFSAVFTGHIHRSQVLGSQNDGCPIIYAGSTERTSFAERKEPKGFMLIDITRPDKCEQAHLSWKFVPIKTRRMYDLTIDIGHKTPIPALDRIKKQLAKIPVDGIVKLTLRVSNKKPPPRLNAELIRSIAPATMNIQTVWKFYE